MERSRMAAARRLRLFDGVGRAVHLAAWKLRLLEYAWAMAERERASRVAVPGRIRARMLRQGFLGESWVLYDLARNDPALYLRDLPRFVRTRLINREAALLLDDKLLFDRFFRAFARHLPQVFGVVRRGRAFAGPDGGPPVDAVPWLAALLRRERALVAKPVSGGGGRGVEVLRLDNRPPDEARLAEVAAGAERRIVTAFVEQHPAMAELHPATTNTLRVLTMQDDAQEPFVAAAAMRVGTAASAPTDNWIRGGLSAEIDPQSGRTGPGAAYPAGRDRMEWHARHPDSGAAIEGFAVPHWPAIRDGLLAMCRAYPPLHYVGWDVVPTEDGFRVIEGNNYTGVNLLQIHRPLLADPRVAAFYRRHGVLA